MFDHGDYFLPNIILSIAGEITVYTKFMLIRRRVWATNY